MSLLNIMMDLKKCCNHPYLFPVAAVVRWQTVVQGRLGTPGGAERHTAPPGVSCSPRQTCTVILG